ncbi:MAG TPA: helix-turn-helix transcriptional regulator [Acidimicrobiales bacterium]
MAITNEFRVIRASDFGTALRHFRIESGKTQVEVAAMERIGQSYLSSLENGRFGSALGHALRLLRLLGCEVIVRRRAPRG